MKCVHICDLYGVQLNDRAFSISISFMTPFYDSMDNCCGSFVRAVMTSACGLRFDLP